MARVSPQQNSFNRGVASPRLHGNQALELYYTALETCRNYVVDGRGILERRPGTRFIGNTKNNGAAALISFSYDPVQSYVLELGDNYLRAWFDYGQVLDGGSPTETASPWTAAEALDIDYEQLNDVMWVAHSDHALRTIQRDSATTFAIGEFVMRDGPYLDQDTQGTTLTPGAYGSVTDTMTSNSTPSPNVVTGSAIDIGDLFHAFDRNNSTRVQFTTNPANVDYDFGAGNDRVVDAYWIRSSAVGNGGERAPSNFKLQGWDGADWITLDTRTGETGWDLGEVRYYSFVNETAYQIYRFLMESSEDGQYIQIAEIGLHERAESQTPVVLTFSSTAGINGGDGFDSDDEGRILRILANDGRWRWCNIVTVNDVDEIEVLINNHSLPDLDAITSWRLGAFNRSNYPSRVCLHDMRLCLGYGDRVSMSVPDDYSNFAPTDLDGTVNPDNAITVSIPSVNPQKGASNKITMMRSNGAQLVVGTKSGLHTIQSNALGDRLSPETVTRRPQDSRGAISGMAVIIGESVFFRHASGKKLMATYYKGAGDRIGAQDVSNAAEHLATPGLSGLALQEEPHNILWAWRADGAISALTVQPEERVQGWHSHVIGGRYIENGVTGNAVVESMTAIPSPDGGEDRLHMIVKRTINGTTKRFVEVLGPFWEIVEGQKRDIRDGWYLDGALKYEGNTDAAKTITFTGGGTDARTAVTSFSSPAFVDGDSLVWHDGVRWHHGLVSGVDGSNNFTWTPSLPNAPPGPADGRWHLVGGSWVQLDDGDSIDVWSPTYQAPANQAAIERWSIGVTSLSGLSDYEGETLDLMLDGIAYRGATVSGGTITGLPTFHIALAGFRCPAQGALLPLEAGSQTGSAQDRQRPVYETVFNVLESRGLEAGTGKPSGFMGTWEQFDAINMPVDDIPLAGEPPQPYTGSLRHPRDEQFDTANPAVAWRVVDPYPSTIRAIVTRLSESDGR